MIILPFAGIVYGLTAFWFSRRVYKGIKIDAYKTEAGKRRWHRNKDTYAIGSLFAGYTWPLFFLVGGLMWAGKGIVWLVVHNQEIPAERDEKIKELEKEIFGEEPKDDVPVSTVNGTLRNGINCKFCSGTIYSGVCVKCHGCWQCGRLDYKTCGHFIEKRIEDAKPKQSCNCGSDSHLDHSYGRVIQKAKAGKGSTVIQVASHNAHNYNSSSSYWSWEE